MPAGAALELNTGMPGWHMPAAAMLGAAVLAALLITPLRWPYGAAVVVSAAAVLWRAWLQERGRGRFAQLVVYSDLSIILVDRDGNECAVGGGVRCWVSPHLVVVRLEPMRGRPLRVVVARELNDPHAFRRFKILCRFAFAEGDP